MEKSKKPQIRFKGFTNDWEQCEVKDIFDLSIKSNIFSRSELTFEKNMIKNIHYGDILIKYNAIVDVKNAKIPYIENHLIKNYVPQFLKNGDIIIADTAEDETTGKVIEISNCNEIKIVAGLHTIVCRPIIKMGLYYLGHYMNSSSYHQQLVPLMQGIKVLSLSRANISKTSILFPKFLNEQEKIGKYFETLDNLITLHQRKCEKLKIMKKSCLEKMFPKNNQKIPDVRFNGFTNDWEQRKLKSYIIEYNEKTKENNQYPVLTSSRKGIFLQKEYFAGNQIASENNIGYNIVPYGFFTYRHMSDDEIFHFNINDIIKNGIVSTLYPVFTTSKELFSKYLQYQLNNGEEFKRFAILQKQGGSRTYMYLSKLKELPLTIPLEITEQKKIGKYFETLDNLITLHQRKVEKLKKIKKSCLEKMFI